MLSRFGNVLSRNWSGWAKTAFKTALLCQFVRILSYQKETSSQLLLVLVGMWIAWVAFGLSLVQRTLALCEELPPYRVVRTGELARETLPPSDAMYTVLLYEWRFFGGGWAFRLMARKYLVRLPAPAPAPEPVLVPMPMPMPVPMPEPRPAPFLMPGFRRLGGAIRGHGQGRGGRGALPLCPLRDPRGALALVQRAPGLREYARVRLPLLRARAGATDG